MDFFIKFSSMRTPQGVEANVVDHEEVEIQRDSGVVDSPRSFIRTAVSVEGRVDNTAAHEEVLKLLSFTDGETSFKEITAFMASLSALNEGEGMDFSHELFMESLYSRRYLPLLEEIMNRSTEISEVAEVNRALTALDKVMIEIHRYQDREQVSVAEAFLNLYEEALDGENDFLTKVKEARDAALDCIRRSKHFFAGHEDLTAEVDAALLEQMERESGVRMPKEFAERLADPNTRSLVVSLDFNSTFNFDESYPSMELVSRAQRMLKRFARDFRRAFPEKELYISINTGRPGLYAWGVVEAAFAPIPEVRKVAVAEAGGVVLEEGLTSGVMNVAVEHPREWKQELDSLRDYLLEQIKNPQGVIIEPKLSMLSIRLAEGEDFVLESIDGEPITPEWIERKLSEYFLNTEIALGREFELLMNDITQDIPHVTAYARKAMEVLGVFEGGHSGLNGGKKKAMAALDHLVADVAEDHFRRIQEIKARMATITTMYDDGLLQAHYNPTAGYVDIGHANLNKYSTLMGHVCQSLGLSRDQVLYLQLGDSTTDIIPEDKLEAGQPNEGADQAFLVAVKNCNAKLSAAVERRGEKGITTINPSILGAEALFKGLSGAVRDARAEG